LNLVKGEKNSKFESCPPNPEALIHSLRAFGYSLSMAIADLIDNSIFAKAGNIAVAFDWNNGQPWFRIADDGIGMTVQKSCLIYSSHLDIDRKR
jgi:hypothetical protein